MGSFFATNCFTSFASKPNAFRSDLRYLVLSRPVGGRWLLGADLGRLFPLGGVRLDSCLQCRKERGFENDGNERLEESVRRPLEGAPRSCWTFEGKSDASLGRNKAGLVSAESDCSECIRDATCQLARQLLTGLQIYIEFLKTPASPGLAGDWDTTGALLSFTQTHVGETSTSFNFPVQCRMAVLAQFGAEMRSIITAVAHAANLFAGLDIAFIRRFYRVRFEVTLHSSL
ncbi:hypothetical protein KC362_g5 [Hortaea werneckii]|nr:hypothetical protein KC362_g5 [Hortaea werneckii]